MLKAIAAHYQRLIDYFVPDEIRNDRGALNQAQMFLISHTMGPILGNSVPIALYLVNPAPGLDILLLSLSITAFWVFPFLLKRGWNYDNLVITSVINLNFCIFWSCYFNGGVLSPTLPWVLIIPILSFFYIGGDTRLQTRLMGIFAGAFALFLLAYYGGNPPKNDTPAVALMSLGIVSTVAALCYVATMSIYYARIYDAGVELESEVRRRRLATEQLRLAIAAADEAGVHKAEFLARMSHELRTPLNAVIGYSQLLKEDAIESRDLQMREDVEHIHDAGHYLLRLINIILDLAKIEAGRMDFSVEEHELIDIVHEAASQSRQTMRESGNTMELFIDTPSSGVETDRLRLIQIIGAILDNTSVHAPKCHVEVRCMQNKVTDNYEVVVRDNGKGIAPERLATLFSSLADRRDAAASKYGGTGLTLTVIYKLAHAIGCDLVVDSTVGKGTCFTIVIPRRWAVNSNRVPDASPVADGMVAA